MDLIVLAVFNCPNKNKFIDKISNFDDQSQQELLNIVEKFQLFDEDGRESIVRRLHYLKFYLYYT